MPSAESYYRRLARLLLADFEYRRGYKFANTVRAFSGWGAALHSYAPVVEEAWFDARPRQPSGKNPNHGSDRNGGYGAQPCPHGHRRGPDHHVPHWRLVWPDFTRWRSACRYSTTMSCSASPSPRRTISTSVHTPPAAAASSTRSTPMPKDYNSRRSRSSTRAAATMWCGKWCTITSASRIWLSAT
jgi:hypothetical protein